MTFGRDRVSTELKKLSRFVIVGTLTFVIQGGLYFIFSRGLFQYLPRTASYILALVYSVVFNYAMNRSWTFGMQAVARGSAKRYTQVASAASLLSAFLFWLGHDILHVFDLYLVVMVNLLIPLFTFVSHRLYTFHDDPGRALKRFVR